jgi:hypothetical protein
MDTQNISITCTKNSEIDMSRFRPFCRPIPLQFLIDFLEPYCTKCNTMLVVNDVAHRKMIVDEETHKKFRRTLLAYYQPAKHRYASRDFTFNSLATIIRHICNLHSHPYTTKIHYDHSQHFVIYYVEYMSLIDVDFYSNTYKRPIPKQLQPRIPDTPENI